MASGGYNCGATPLVLKPFVTIEGAGRSFTRIFGRSQNGDNSGVVVGANETALRHLTVEHMANAGGNAVAVSTGGRRMRLADVVIKIEATNANHIIGILAHGGAVDLTNMSVQTTNPSGEASGINAASVKLTMMNVWVRNQGAAGNPAALMLIDGSVTGYGILLSSNVFGILGSGNAAIELVGGMINGGRGVGGGFTGSFSCLGVAKGDFTPRSADCN